MIRSTITTIITILKSTTIGITKIKKNPPILIHKSSIIIINIKINNTIAVILNIEVQRPPAMRASITETRGNSIMSLGEIRRTVSQMPASRSETISVEAITVILPLEILKLHGITVDTRSPDTTCIEWRKAITTCRIRTIKEIATTNKITTTREITKIGRNPATITGKVEGVETVITEPRKDNSECR